MSITRNTISFTRRDKSTKFDPFVMEVAEHFKVKRPYFDGFVRFINTSRGWKVTDLEDRLSRWNTSFSKLGGRPEIIDIVKRAFELCENDEDLCKLRGLLLEALVIACHGGPEILGNNKNYGWGVSIDIHTESRVRTVRYECQLPLGEECYPYSKMTVDFVNWNGRHGRFYECKVLPKTISCVDKQYLIQLKKQMNDEGVSHEIFFVCAEHKDEIENKIKELELPPSYKAIGTRELATLRPA